MTLDVHAKLLYGTSKLSFVWASVQQFAFLLCLRTKQAWATWNKIEENMVLMVVTSLHANYDRNLVFVRCNAFQASLKHSH